MKKVLLVIPSLKKGGGAEKMAVNIISNLQGKYDFRVLTFYHFEETYQLSVPTFSLNETTGKSGFQQVTQIFRRLRFVRSHLKSFAPNVTLSLLFDANLISLLAARKKDKVIVSVRGNIDRMASFKKKISVFLYHRAKLVHCQTLRMQENLRQLGLKNTHLIYNSHDFKLMDQLANEYNPSQLDPEKYTFLTVGRLVSEKGHWHLLKAFSELRKKVKARVQLIILGEGYLEPEIKGLIQALDLESCVKLTGFVDNVYPFYQSADAFVFTSVSEGLPNSLIEAAYFQMPIVSTDCVSGPREILAPEVGIEDQLQYPYSVQNGYLIKPFPVANPDFSTNVGPLEKELAKEMEEVMVDMKERDLSSFPGISRFSKEETLKNWEEVFGEC